MSNEANMHEHAEVITHHDVHHDEHHVHHHKETFITKYIFSQDHKTIGKQFFDHRYCVGDHWWFVFCTIPFAIGLSGANLPDP